MGKKSRRQRPTNPVLPKPAKSASPTAGSFPYGHLIPSSETRAKPSTLDEAKAELICAAAALSPRRRSGQIRDWILEPRFNEAVTSLCTFVRIESAATREIGDDDYFDDYITRNIDFLTEPEQVSKVIMRWLRYQKYWPRIRRRLCWGCGKQYDLSEPRLWVCGGCGDARYCDETCQAAHWLSHSFMCCEMRRLSGNYCM